ncbi:DUF6124 family protein [Pseudomonas fluorescens]|uniref:DUF3077 domain-containing protein n=1 Tax=Pseudomonas fluorescens R124 TaxID=743713 RepID=A0A7U9CM91_PSEFL|nr:hypothetical protein [Pseudomonas fluorescens]EJZ57926.1 hypothetical protein I1A_002251 [Pseudomonas fluorescens R124]RBL67916.1 hypothetical protein C3E98_029205 [Pseudomonas sp. MWU13-2625]
MFKATPNPPDVDPIPYDPALDPQKIKAATDRAINFYLNPGALKISIPSVPSGKSSRIFLIDPTVDEETLLVEACESLAAASDMARDIGDVVDNPQRRAMLMLHQVIMLSELMVNRVLDGRRVPN